MNKNILHCTVISPMFSYGNQKLELRPSELKGLIRYIYRIANCSIDAKLLYEAESECFGDAEKHASPVRLQMKMTGEKLSRQTLMLHNKAPGKNSAILAFSLGTTFDVIIKTQLRTNKGVIEKTQEWYNDHILLSLILGGMGKRTRRGRGCVSIPEITEKNNHQLLMWITDRLNGMNEKKFLYEIKNNVIISIADLYKFKRPIIEKIELGRKIDNMNDFLKYVDEATHKIKKDPPGCVRNDQYATGFVYNGRFSSSVIVSVTQTNEGIFPIYTYVKAVYRGSPLDVHCEERDKFVGLIEEGRH